jgi:electron transport complex protein RnfG
MIGTKEISRITLNLVVIYLIGGLLLAVVFVTTSPLIFSNNNAAKIKALQKIMPEADNITPIARWKPHDNDAEIYAAKKAGQTSGYIVESYGKGYSGLIHVLVATDPDLKIIRINILSHTETPGLGDEIESGWFQNQFAGKSESQMKVIKGPTAQDIQAITGATISSRAVTEDAVKNALEALSKTVNISESVAQPRAPEQMGTSKISGKAASAITGSANAHGKDFNPLPGKGAERLLQYNGAKPEARDSVETVTTATPSTGGQAHDSNSSKGVKAHGR